MRSSPSRTIGADSPSIPRSLRREHIAWKSDAPGLVEIWEPIGPEKKEEPTDWRLPMDYVSASDPAALCARKVARKAKSLLSEAEGAWVEGEAGPRRVEPGDILILVRKRDAFFEAVIRALKEEHIPVAGADRLDLASHIAVMDLCALGDAALLPQDDLTLATLLKSPLVGLDDDDLIALAPRRDGALIDALRQSPQARASGGGASDRRMAASRLRPSRPSIFLRARWAREAGASASSRGWGSRPMTRSTNSCASR